MGGWLPGDDTFCRPASDEHAGTHDVPNPGEIVVEANRYYQRPSEASVSVLQLVATTPKAGSPGKKTTLPPSCGRDQVPSRLQLRRGVRLVSRTMSTSTDRME